MCENRKGYDQNPSVQFHCLRFKIEFFPETFRILYHFTIWCRRTKTIAITTAIKSKIYIPLISQGTQILDFQRGNTIGNWAQLALFSHLIGWREFFTPIQGEMNEINAIMYYFRLINNVLFAALQIITWKFNVQRRRTTSKVCLMLLFFCSFVADKAVSPRRTCHFFHCRSRASSE